MGCHSSADRAKWLLPGHASRPPLGFQTLIRTKLRLPGRTGWDGAKAHSTANNRHWALHLSTDCRTRNNINKSEDFKNVGTKKPQRHWKPELLQAKISFRNTFWKTFHCDHFDIWFSQNYLQTVHTLFCNIVKLFSFCEYLVNTWQVQISGKCL